MVCWEGEPRMVAYGVLKYCCMVCCKDVAISGDKMEWVGAVGVVSTNVLCWFRFLFWCVYAWSA